MTFAKAEKQGETLYPGGYKELGIAPTLGSMSCGQVFNINNADVKLAVYNFPPLLEYFFG